MELMHHQQVLQHVQHVQLVVMEIVLKQLENVIVVKQDMDIQMVFVLSVQLENIRQEEQQLVHLVQQELIRELEHQVVLLVQMVNLQKKKDLALVPHVQQHVMEIV